MNPASPIPFQLTEFPPDQFQILELLGQGGMGQVFKARDRHLNRPVALKFVLAHETPGMLVRLVLEAQYQASLDHPHIAKVYGVGRFEGRTCVVMQLIEGLGLDRMAPDLSLDQKVQLIIQAARGMHAAHLHGLIHRDLKPQNILVESRGPEGFHAYVVDFGLARATEAESLTISGAVMGSPNYMSPEQALGGRLVDARSDIYSLGATLYALVVGYPPFSYASTPNSIDVETRPEEGAEALGAPEPGPNAPKKEYHALSILRRVLDESPLPPRQVLPELSLDLETIILRCLEKDPAERYPTSAALADDLERFLAGQPIWARRASWPKRARAWSTRHPKLSAALVALLGASLLALTAGGLAVRRTRLKAEIGNRFEQAAEECVLRFRMGALSPQQNRAAEVARLMERMELHKKEARALGPLASGPASYFQGRALLILGRHREAWVELQQAWDHGFRSQGVAQALGTALLEIYSAESRNLMGDFSQRKAEQQALAVKYLHPAQTFLQRAAQGNVRKNLLLAQLAFAEGRDEEALQLADADLRTTPWSLEALRLRFFVWIKRNDAAQDLANFETTAQEAEAQLQILRDVARGDPQSHLAEARWWIIKARRLFNRFRSPHSELVHRGLGLAEEVSKLDPSSHEAFALRAEGWGLLVDLLSLEGRPVKEVSRCFDQVLVDSDQALKLNPTCQEALLSRAFIKVIRNSAGAGKGDPDFREALKDAERVLELHPRSAEAYRLKSIIHALRARESALKGENSRSHHQASADSTRELTRLWPNHPEYGKQACAALMRVAFSDALVGKTELALAHFQEARRILDQDLLRSPGTPDMRLQQIRLARMEGNLEGLLRRSPQKSYERAARILAETPQDLRNHPDFIEENFTLLYEQAQVDLEQGKEISPQLSILRSILDDWRKAKRPVAWLLVNQIMLARLKGLQDLHHGPTLSAWPQRGFHLLHTLKMKYVSPAMDVVPGMEGALLIQSAQALRGSQRQDLLAKGRRGLETSLALDPSLSWTFRQEIKMARSNKGE